MGKLLALVSILVVAQPAYAQVKCGNDAIRDFQNICGRNIDEGPCNLDAATRLSASRAIRGVSSALK